MATKPSSGLLLKEIFVSLGLEVDEAKFAKGQLAASLITAAFEKVVEIGKEVVETFVENVKETISYGYQTSLTAQQIGVTTDALQELQYAASMSGVSAEDLSRSVGFLARNMKEAKDGSEEAAKAFKGIEYKKANGELKSADEVLVEVAERFKGMPDGIEKTAEAMKLFGRGGKQMIPFLNEGAEGIEELREEAKKLGVVMDGSAIDASKELTHVMHKLHAVTEGMWRSAIAPLLPALKALAERFLAWRKANAQIMAQKLQWFIGGLIKGFNMLGDTITFLNTNATSLMVILGVLTVALIAAGHAAVATAISTAAAWAVAAAPFVAIAAAITLLLLLLDDIRGYYAGEDSEIGHLFQMFDDWLKPRAGDPWWLVQVKEFLRILNDASRAMVSFGEKVVANFDKIGSVLKYLPPILIGRLGMAAINKGRSIGDGGQAQADEAYAAANPNAASVRPDGTPIPDNPNAASVRPDGTPIPDNPNAASVRPDGTPIPDNHNAASVRTDSASVPMESGNSSQMSSSSVNAPMNFNISQLAGESTEGLAQRIGAVVKDVLQGEYSAAAAGVKGQ